MVVLTQGLNTEDDGETIYCVEKYIETITFEHNLLKNKNTELQRAKSMSYSSLPYTRQIADVP